MKAPYGVDTIPETAENVVDDFSIYRKNQDAFELRAQDKAERAMTKGRLASEIAR